MTGVVFRHLDAGAGTARQITPAGLADALVEVFTLGTSPLLVAAGVTFDPAAAVAELRRLAPLLHGVMDLASTGSVAFLDLQAGLVALCGGDAEDNARTLFRIADADGSGAISRNELVHFLTQIVVVNRLLQPPEPGAPAPPPAADVAAATADSCLASADTDRDGSLSVEEYIAWFLASSGSPAEAAGAPAAGHGSGELSGAAAVPS